MTHTGRGTGRGLILDFGGGVTTDFHAELASFCAREGLPPDAVSRALRDTLAGRRALAAAECGRISQREFEITLAGLIGADDRGLLTRALAGLRPRGPVLDLVARVRARGIPAAVLSNSLGRGSYNLCQGYELDRHFDAVVISDRAGLRKPDPAIYRLAAAMLGVPATSCVFADDTEANLPTANALGMAVVLFTNAAAAVAEIEYLLNRPPPGDGTPLPGMARRMKRTPAPRRRARQAGSVSMTRLAANRLLITPAPWRRRFSLDVARELGLCSRGPGERGLAGSCR